MARPDPRRVLLEQLDAIAAGVAQVRRCSAEEGLAEIRKCLTKAKVKPGSRAASVALTCAAAFYVVDEPDIDQWWYEEAFRFLVQAGANEEAAREMFTS